MMNKFVVSKERKEYLNKIKQKKFLVIFTQIAFLEMFLIFWEFLANKKIIDSFITSQPSAIWETFKNLGSNGLSKHIGVTVYETIVGFSIGTVVGVIIAIILIGANESNFLSTIKSRCTIIKFQNISDEEIRKYMIDKYSISEISESMLKLYQGSIGKAEILNEKKELYEDIVEIIEEVNTLDLVDFLKKADLIYKPQEDKYEILESINVILFNKSKEDIRFLNCIDIIEDTKKRLSSNGNYNMCIDNMLFKIWEEMH